MVGDASIEADTENTDSISRLSNQPSAMDNEAVDTCPSVDSGVDTINLSGYSTSATSLSQREETQPDLPVNETLGEEIRPVSLRDVRQRIIERKKREAASAANVTAEKSESGIVVDDAVTESSRVQTEEESAQAECDSGKTERVAFAAPEETLVDSNTGPHVESKPRRGRPRKTLRKTQEETPLQTVEDETEQEVLKRRRRSNRDKSHRRSECSEKNLPHSSPVVKRKKFGGRREVISSTEQSGDEENTAHPVKKKKDKNQLITAEINIPPPIKGKKKRSKPNSVEIESVKPITVEVIGSSVDEEEGM